MKKQNILVCLCAVVCVCGIFNGCNIEDAQKNNTQNTTDMPISVFEEIDIEDKYANSKDIQVFANYTDSSGTFSELMEEANYIVKATVTSTYKKSVVTQTSTLTVTEVYKGDMPEEITLYQMAGDNNVINGNEYILFINKQNVDDVNSNVFYSCGGGQGVMRIDAEDKKIIVNSEILLGEDISVWLENRFVDYIAEVKKNEEN